jgi:Zn-dependent protease with chaperone function
MKAQTKAQSFSISKLDVSSSSMKVWLFLAILSLAHLFIGYQLGGRLGLFIGLLLAVVFNFLLFTYTDNRLLNFFNAEEILGRDSWKLLDRAKIFARNAGMEKPKIFVAEHPTPFAFSLAHLGRNGSVCLSSSLLNKLDDIEVSAVLAHQICKISTLQSLSSGAASSVANAFLGLAYTLDQFPPIRLAKPFTRMISQSENFMKMTTKLHRWLKIDILSQTRCGKSSPTAKLCHFKRCPAQNIYLLSVPRAATG